MKLPKLFRVVTVEFWGLRNGLGSNYGVVFDIDTKVRRKARRVISPDGWKWQIDLKDWDTPEYDYFIESDIESLNECGSDDVTVIC